MLVALGGCSKKGNPTSEMEKAAEALAQPAPDQPPPQAPVQSAETPQATATPPTEPPPAQEMQQAMAAYKAGALEDAVTRLHKLRATRAMTPQQRIALNDAMAAVMSEIYGLAANGDQRAIQAVKQYERLQTQPR
jgi:hypothetical protein